MNLGLHNINIVAVLVAAAAAYIVGGLYYYLGEDKVVGSDERRTVSGPMKKEDRRAFYAVRLVTTVVVAAVLDVIVKGIGATTPAEGAMLGTLCWVGFQATFKLERMLWENAGRKGVVFRAGYQLITSVLVGAIVAAMR